VSIVFDISHVTEYRYAKPVGFGEHRLMFRPRDSHDLRVLATDLKVDPEAVGVRMIQDVYSNSIALVQPRSPADRLRLTCLFTVEATGSRPLELPLSPGALEYPFEYSAEDRIALQHYLAPYYDADAMLMSWARSFIRNDGPTGSRELLVEMTQAIRNSMSYQPRGEEGVQAPIEAVRRLGYAARFISGYVYTPGLDAAAPSKATAGATHAWLQVYLPGAGWLAFDPTNNLIGGTDLIRVGVARHASLASPVSGSWQGVTSDYLGMTVDVQVTKRE